MFDKIWKMPSVFLNIFLILVVIFLIVGFVCDFPGLMGGFFKKRTPDRLSCSNFSKQSACLGQAAVLGYMACGSHASQHCWSPATGLCWCS